MPHSTASDPWSSLPTATLADAPPGRRGNTCWADRLTRSLQVVLWLACLVWTVCVMVVHTHRMTTHPETILVGASAAHAAVQVLAGYIVCRCLERIVRAVLRVH